VAGDDPRQAALEHDLAHLQLLLGHPRRARVLLERVLPRRPDPAGRGQTLALQARAAAAPGD
jgi:hypothetical protein